MPLLEMFIVGFIWLNLFFVSWAERVRIITLTQMLQNTRLAATKSAKNSMSFGSVETVARDEVFLPIRKTSSCLVALFTVAFML